MTRCSRAANDSRIAAARTLQHPLAESGMRLALGAAGALVLAHSPGPRLACPLLSLTGIPCPLCGSTTAATRLGRLDVVGAVLANPVVLLLAAMLVAAPLLVRRRPGLRLPGAALAGLLALSWLWQLARIDLVPL